VFVLSLLVNGLLAYWLARGLIDTDRNAFETDALRTLESVRERVGTTVTLLRGTAGLFIASDTVTREDFRAYIGRLRLRELYPGIQGIGYTAHVEPARVAALEASMRAVWGPRFEVWPDAQDSAREILTSILYLEPLDERNYTAIGYDMASEPTRRAAMLSARDDGLARASGPVTLVQEIHDDKQIGFLIYLPLYATREAPLSVEDRRRTLRGFVHSPLRVDDLLAGTRGAGVRQIDYELFDVTGAEPVRMRSTRAAGSVRVPRFTLERTIDVEGRRWQLRFASSAEFDARSQQRFLPVLIGIALGASLLLGAITWVQTRGRIVAQQAAAERRAHAAAQRRRSERLQQLAQATPRLNAARAQDAVVLALEAEARHLFDTPQARLHFDDAPAPPGGLAATLTCDDAQSLGTITVAAREPAADGSARGFDDDDRLLLRQFAGIAGIALRNARLYGELRDNDRRKDEFLATLAHELRNPLAPIRTSLEIIRSAPGSPYATKARDVAERQTVHMVRLIDDLLDISRITRGTIVLQREPVRIAAAIDAALETSMPHVRARGHEVELQPIDPAWTVTGDAARLAQIFSNLLNNAANYTEPGGRITIRASRERATVHVSVCDTGIGIAPEMLPRIFDMFMQASRSRHRGGGLGLGLTLVRQLVELHGGSISAHSDGPGHGSEFKVCLPLATAAADATAADPRGADTIQPNQRRLLVVDDNLDAADSLATLLRIDGHAVEIAHDGRSALALAERGGFDALLLDIGLPDLSGYEVARRLRALPLAPPPRLIAVSGWGQHDDRQQAREAGFDLHLIKPVDHAALQAHLRRLFDS
nr:CHASE domain-containing protein [Burkholderiaceae bacterium]